MRRTKPRCPRERPPGLAHLVDLKAEALETTLATPVGVAPVHRPISLQNRTRSPEVQNRRFT